MTALTAFANPPDPNEETTATGRPTLESILDVARKRIEVSDEELVEARSRRDLILTALLVEFPGSETYLNGSVAHGDALDPLTDVDLGIIVAEAVDTHGPGKKGCSDLEERAAEVIRKTLRPQFENLRVEWRGRKRSVLVRFGDPVTPGQDDFTADVIVAIDNTDPDDNRGLWIPNHMGWDRSHPQEHTGLVKQANKKSNNTYARVVRPLKHWNRRNGRPLVSWNIKALALGVLSQPSSLLAGLEDWFDYAIAELKVGLTEDPAGVAEKPISINKDLTRTEVVRQLEDARRLLTQAVGLEMAGYPAMAHESLAKMFNDPEMMPLPDPEAVRTEAVRKYTADRKTAQAATGSLMTAVNVGAASDKLARPVRSWSQRPL